MRPTTRRPSRTSGRGRAVLAVVAAAVVLVVASCDAGNPDVDSRAATMGLPDLLVDLSADQWILDQADTTVEVGPQPVSVEFHPDRTVSGTGPCNTFRGSVELGDASVTITDLAVTARGCDAATMDHEAALLAALTEVREVDRSDRDRLVLRAPDGTRLAFTPA